MRSSLEQLLGEMLHCAAERHRHRRDHSADFLVALHHFFHACLQIFYYSSFENVCALMILFFTFDLQSTKKLNEILFISRIVFAGNNKFESRKSCP